MNSKLIQQQISVIGGFGLADGNSSATGSKPGLACSAGLEFGELSDSFKSATLCFGALWVRGISSISSGQ